MDKKEAIELAKSYKKLIAPHFPKNRLYLFGSYSKGTQTEESDIDIAVIIDTPVNDFFEEVPLLWKIRREVNSSIEPILLSSTEDKNSPIYKEVITSGILI